MDSVVNERILIQFTRKQINDFKHMMNLIREANRLTFTSPVIEVLYRADTDTIERLQANATPTDGTIVYVAEGAL